VAAWKESQLIRPMLEVLADASERKNDEVDRLVEERLGLPAGELRRDSNEVDWAKSTLTATRCVEDPRNPGAKRNLSGIYRITQLGKDALAALRRQPEGFRPPMRIRGFGGWLTSQGIGFTPVEVAAPASGEIQPASPSQREPSELYGLARELHVDEGWLREVVELLEDPRKHQVIFYGPPGTGKTYIARKLVGFLTGGDPQRSETVQFHPSYSYEDFVQGYRPRPGPDGSLSYALADGPLVRLAGAASEAPNSRHILLIDELNRGNLPRIFGELLYLLEYRDEKVTLMYSGEGAESFSLPDNLWILGTMNTADRSIGLIDAALRRRFHFVPLFPDEPPLGGLLRRWLSQEAPSMGHVATYVDRLNARLRERFGRSLQVGPSHFMVKDLDDAKLESIWKYDIMPFLEDQLFGHEDELEAFSLKALASGHPAVASGAQNEAGYADDQAQRIRGDA